MPTKEISDEDLIRAIRGLSDVYEYNGRSPTDDCVRLTFPDARRLATLAEVGFRLRPHAVS